MAIKGHANLGALSVATILFESSNAGSASLSKQKWPGVYTITLPSVGSGVSGITVMTESSNTVGAVFSPTPDWGGVLLNFAYAGNADLSITYEIGRLTATGTMPTVLGSLVTKGITTSGTFTANINPFTGAAVTSTTYRLCDLFTLTSRSNLGELLVNVGGTEDNTPGHVLMDTTVMPYYYVLLTNLSTATKALCCITPQP